MKKSACKFGFRLPMQACTSETIRHPSPFAHCRRAMQFTEVACHELGIGSRRCGAPGRLRCSQQLARPILSDTGKCSGVRRYVSTSRFLSRQCCLSQNRWPATGDETSASYSSADIPVRWLTPVSPFQFVSFCPLAFPHLPSNHKPGLQRYGRGPPQRGSTAPLAFA
jgi:hypothetical protein